MNHLPVSGDVAQLDIVCDDVAIETGEEALLQAAISVDENAIQIRVMGEIKIGFELALVVRDRGIAGLARRQVLHLVRDLAVQIPDPIASREEKAGTRRGETMSEKG